ncbi:hypothetical protein T05_11537 [Trichinella murrelli]|uniref:Uncharacterized protein n=1 Tax=Trichinella murrelli TaxID=144512 RepID=A0A0V0TC18_9BILA|nr:hypothetical protein T05_11537 [Trichinella murrelli]
MLFNAILDKHVKLNNPMHVLMTTDHQYTKRSLWLPIYQFKGITLLLLSKINFSIFIQYGIFNTTKPSVCLLAAAASVMLAIDDYP